MNLQTKMHLFNLQKFTFTKTFTRKDMKNSILQRCKNVKEKTQPFIFLFFYTYYYIFSLYSLIFIYFIYKEYNSMVYSKLRVNFLCKSDLHFLQTLNLKQ
jgi:hypothetical protein